MRPANSPRVVKKLSNGTVVVRSNTKYGMRQMRCPRCHSMCAPTRLPSGKQVVRCSSCGMNFTMQQVR